MTADTTVPARKTRRAPTRSASAEHPISDTAYATWNADAMLPAAVPESCHSCCRTGSVAA